MIFQDLTRFARFAFFCTKIGTEGCVNTYTFCHRTSRKETTPDYRNAIKEAISAVESVAKQIVGADAATLDGALKELSDKSDVHGALKAGFSKLYGYTSDENGIRHSILEEPNVGFAEAKYMVVSCSAFVHYLIQKAESAGLLKQK